MLMANIDKGVHKNYITWRKERNNEFWIFWIHVKRRNPIKGYIQHQLDVGFKVSGRFERLVWPLEVRIISMSPPPPKLCQIHNS